MLQIRRVDECGHANQRWLNSHHAFGLEHKDAVGTGSYLKSEDGVKAEVLLFDLSPK